jgi:ribosomal protein S18 acetylase RimI-like enzyme
MSKFKLTVGAENLGTQIADLLNQGGQLWYPLVRNSILFTTTQYIIEMNGEIVIGVIGLDKKNARVTELKHLCVHPDYRRRGLGKKMLEKGIEASTTEFVYGTVRSNNAVNVRNNLRVGMRPLGKIRKRGYHIIVFGRRRCNAVGK